MQIVSIWLNTSSRRKVDLLYPLFYLILLSVSTQWQEHLDDISVGTIYWLWINVTVEAFMPHYPLVFSEDIGIKSIWTDNLGVLSNVIHHIHKHTKYNMQWNACVPTDRLWTWSRHLTSEKLPEVGIELATPTPKVWLSSCQDWIALAAG